MGENELLRGASFPGAYTVLLPLAFYAKLSQSSTRVWPVIITFVRSPAGTGRDAVGFQRHVGAASRTSSAGDMAHSRHAYGRDQGCCALDSPADDCVSSAQPSGHPHQDRHPGNGLNTTCIEPQDFMARRQDIARRDVNYSVYSDRPDAAPSSAPDAPDRFDMSFLFRKVEDVTTISISQSLTSVSIKDCILRVPNKTTTLFLYEQ